MNYPIEYQVVEQPSMQSNLLRTILSLRIGRRKVDSVPEGFMLVKMMMAPFNPSDIAFLQGSYNVKKALPAVPGFEGAGIVVALGEGLASEWLGRKVACFAGNDGDGTWAEYLLAKPDQVLAFDESLGWEQAATFLVNPFTAHAMFALAIDAGIGCIALNAAGSRVADWMRAFADRNKLETINIVRKAEVKDQLIDKGVKNVLVSNDEHFAEEFRRIAHELDCRMAFDAVGGNLGGQMLNAMPGNSRLIVYGGLSNLPLGELDVLGLIFRGKKVEGFDLNQWWVKSSMADKQLVAAEIAELIQDGSVLNQISQIVDLKDVASGLRHYLGHMSEGKVLLRM